MSQDPSNPSEFESDFENDVDAELPSADALPDPADVEASADLESVVIEVAASDLEKAEEGESNHAEVVEQPPIANRPAPNAAEATTDQPAEALDEEPPLVATVIMEDSDPKTSQKQSSASSSSPKPTSTPSPGLSLSAIKTAALTVFKTVKQFWLIVAPVLQAFIILSLHLIIKVLQWFVRRLEGVSGSSRTNSQTPSTQVVSTTAQETARSPSDASTQLRPGFERLKTAWGGAIAKIRSLLPAPWNEKLPSFVISGGLASVLVLLVWVSSSLIFASKAPPPARLELPTLEEIPQEVPQTEPIEPTLKSPPEKTIAFIEEPPSEPVIPPIAEPPTEPSTPFESSSEQPPIMPPVAPQLALSPEQERILAIQNQVAEVTDRYAEGLIHFVQANFQNSQLTVAVSEGWYELEPNRQDRLAADLLDRSRILEFTKLKIVDSTDNLLARSPVVGSTMLILQRNQPVNS